MSSCGYACVGCGQCQGVLPKPIFVKRCIYCGLINEQGSKTCAVCGASLKLQPGATNTISDPRLKK